MFSKRRKMLNKAQIKKLIDEKRLIENCLDLETQLTPNGFDLTAGVVSEFSSGAALDFSNKERVLPQTRELEPSRKNPEDQHGWWKLARGVYKVKTNEIINMPNDLTALAFSRTSLLRMGAFTQNGVWDAGFCGKSEFVLVVENTFGIELKQNSRVVQLVFFSVSETEEYNGIYKHLK
jgi:dUTP pyrophosphatase